MKREARNHPKLIRLARELGIPMPHAGGLMEFLWLWCGDYAISGDITSVSDEAVVGAGWEGEPGKFIEALIKCRLVDRSDDGRLTVHDWIDHRPDYVTKRAVRRMSQGHTDNGCQRPPTAADGVLPNPTQPVPTQPNPTKRPGPAVGGPCWTLADGWSGITAKDREDWAAAFPACDLDRQLAAASEWLKANPTKARKSNWRKFITGWLSRQQDRGGDAPTSRLGGRSPASALRDAIGDAEIESPFVRQAREKVARQKAAAGGAG